MNDQYNAGDDGADDAMIAALKGLDGPRRPAPESFDRVEAAMLSRFDDLVADDDTEKVASPSLDGTQADQTQFVELDARRIDTSSRGRRWQPLLAVAAVVAVAIVGWQITRGAEGTEVAVPSEQRDELSAQYCTQFLDPLVGALQLWSPNGSDSEARQDVQLAVEQAIQGYLDAGSSLGAENQARWESMLEQASAVRLLARGRNQAPADDALADLTKRVANNIDNTDWSPDSAACSGDLLRAELADE